MELSLQGHLDNEAQHHLDDDNQRIHLRAQSIACDEFYSSYAHQISPVANMRGSSLSQPS